MSGKTEKILEIQGTERIADIFGAFDANAAMKTIYDAMFNRLKLDVIVTFDNGQTETRTLIFACNGADPDTGLIVLSAKIQ